MGKGLSTIVFGILLAACGPAAAATFTVEVADQNGGPVANAVVALFPDNKAAMPASSTRLTNEQTIDQRNETFVPLVTVIPRGGRIVFANNDQTTHQVYSFSAVKQFEITLSRGQSSSPIAFDKAGVAALGCNIHDHMIAYAYVAESPWTMLTGADGRATIDNVPAGNYQAQVWHPKFPPGREVPSAQIAVSGDTTRWSASVKLPAAPVMAHSHAGSY
jgi:plastocyanin